MACFIYGCSTKNISNKNEEDYITNKMINDDNNMSHSSASILDKYGNNDLHRSAKENNYSFIKNFIDSFSNNDFHFLLAALEAKNFAGETALYILAKNSCLDTIKMVLCRVEYLLKSVVKKESIGKILSLENNCGYNTIDIAAINGHEHCVIFLSDYVDLEQLESTKSKLSLYTQGPNPSMMELLDNMIRIKNLYISVKNKNLNDNDLDDFKKILCRLSVQDFCDHKYESQYIKEVLNQRNGQEFSLIHSLSKEGRIDFIKIILKHITTDELEDMIHTKGCSCNCHESVIKLLFDIDQEGNIQLHNAIKNGKYSRVNDIFGRYEDKVHRYKATIEMLKTQNKQRDTPLHILSKMWNKDNDDVSGDILKMILKELIHDDLNKDIDEIFSIQNNDLFTCIDLDILKYNNTNFIEILLGELQQHGCIISQDVLESTIRFAENRIKEIRSRENVKYRQKIEGQIQLVKGYIEYPAKPIDELSKSLSVKGKRSDPCPKCGKIFYDNGALNQHIKRKH
ncbi:hypothetical protein [Cardinium endosymbiont of Nabis limbatus]|uniref:hypothetical protein n=1 Tax=Cardinium endosymbiont of Nabis limbatus TaxID=3066217 RepID=UPI003AF3C18F